MLAEVEKIADRVVIMKEGKVVLSGNLDDIKSSYKLVVSKDELRGYLLKTLRSGERIYLMKKKRYQRTFRWKMLRSRTSLRRSSGVREMFNKEFRDMRVRFLVMFFILLGTFVLLVVVKDYTQNLSEIIRSAPKNILEKFGVTDEFMKKLSRWDFYIITQWYGKNLGQFVPILAIIMAFPVFAREIENETMELLLVRVKRRRLFMVKFFIPLVFTLLALVVLAVLPLPVSWIIGESLDASSVFRYLLVETIGIFLWFSITIFFSLLFSDQVKPLIVSIALLAGTTALGSFIKLLSILNTYLYILKGDLVLWPSLAYTLAGVVFTYLSYKVLETKDF